jgi:hypothetical protein
MHRTAGSTLGWAGWLWLAARTVSAEPSPELVPWTRTTSNILTGFVNMYQPCVRRVSDPVYPYRMWFMGWAANDCNSAYPGCDAIFLARSRDLGKWEVYRRQLNGQPDWDATGTPSRWRPVITARNLFYDQDHNGDPSVVIHTYGIYYMAYSATGFDVDGIPSGQSGDTDHHLNCIMGAVSTNGISWTRSRSPLLMHQPEVGRPNAYERDPAYRGDFHRPSLMFDGDHWRMWFDYWVGNGVGVGLGHAECSGDPMEPSNWRITHLLDQPLIREWPNPDVIKIGGRYYLCGDPSGYDGTGWANRQIREAVSDDGLRWTLLSYLPPDPDTPACQVPQYFLDESSTDFYLFYACQIGGTPYNWRYDRVRFMHKSISNADPRLIDPSVLGLFNTGVNPQAQPLPAGAPDPHYTLVERGGHDEVGRPDGVPLAAAQVFVTPAHAPENWLPNDSISAWLSFPTSSLSASPGGWYQYEIGFDLTGLSLPSVEIRGRWLASDNAQNVRVNGQNTPNATQGGAWNVWTHFTLTHSNTPGGFNPGPNTLRFLTWNNDTGSPAYTATGPSGLRVEFLGVTVDPQPVPLAIQVQADGQVRMSWPVGKIDLHLEASGTLVPGTWTNVPVAPIRTQGWETVTVPAAAAHQFFRLAR